MAYGLAGSAPRGSRWSRAEVKCRSTLGGTRDTPPEPGSGAALGPQTNEKRRLTLEDAETRFRRSAAAFNDFWQVTKTPELDVVAELEPRRGCWTPPVISENTV